MFERTTARKTLSRWIDRRIEAFGRRLHAAGDAAAHLHGWQITASGHGLVRSYRDARFGATAQITAVLGVCQLVSSPFALRLAPPPRSRSLP